jgi:hypothetical protein
MAIPLLFWASISTSNAIVPQTVRCEDGTKAVRLLLTFAKNDSAEAPAKVVIVSSGKSKEIEKKHLIRFVRNANEFYLLFKVQTKAGLHEIELKTRMNKNPRALRTSAGTLTNKTQDEQLNVTCWF